MTDFAYRNGFNAPIPAQLVGESLEQIRDANDGKLTAADVVDTAKRKTHPLHPAFTWSDADAAMQYRLHEARTLIRSVRVVTMASDTGDTIDVAAFVHVPSKTGPGRAGYYQNSAECTGDEWASAVEALTGKLRAAQHALDDLARLAAGRGDSANLAVVTIANAFATINKALEGARQ